MEEFSKESTSEEFSENFNLDNAEKLLTEEINKSDQIKKTRKYIYQKYRKAITNYKEYFIINLSECQPIMRGIVIKELLVRFPDIGYQGSDTISIGQINGLIITDEYQTDSLLKFPRRIQKIFKICLNDINTTPTHYLIAITKKFGKEMINFGW